MAQWFKNLFRRQSENQKILEFNELKLKTELHNLAASLYGFHKETSFVIIREMIDLAKNRETVLLAKSGKPDAMPIYHARIALLCDFNQMIEWGIEAGKNKEKEQTPNPRGGLRMGTPRKTSNQAGSAF